jgi:hypothetical protein
MSRTRCDGHTDTLRAAPPQRPTKKHRYKSQELAADADWPLAGIESHHKKGPSVSSFWLRVFQLPARRLCQYKESAWCERHNAYAALHLSSLHSMQAAQRPVKSRAGAIKLGAWTGDIKWLERSGSACRTHLRGWLSAKRRRPLDRVLGPSPLRMRASFAHDTKGAPHRAGGMGVRLGGSGWAAAFGTHG